MRQIPVTLLTGFLGSGKTTILNTLVRQQPMAQALVVINEFGEVGLDHLLVAHSKAEGVVTLENGCLCCTIRGDLQRTLKDAVWRFSRNGRRQFDRVIIETTGLADPAPILSTLLNDPGLKQYYALDGIVTTVDACNGSGTLDRHPESRRQLAAADVVLLTKTDMVQSEVLQTLFRRIQAINPGVRILDTQGQTVQAADVLNSGVSAVGVKTDVADWLRQPMGEQIQHKHGHFSEHGHEGHAKHCSASDDPFNACEPYHAEATQRHDHAGHHDDGIRSYTVVLHTPLDPLAFTQWCEIVKGFLGDRLLRLKALLNIRGLAHPMVVHAVQHVFHDPVPLEQWPSADRSSRLVFIMQDVDADALRQTLDIFQ